MTRLEERNLPTATMPISFINTIVADNANYTYDKNGNLTFDGTYRYYYDVENRLTEVNDAGDQRVATYKYDFAGRKVARIVGTTTTTYLYDGDQVIVEYENGSWKRRYYYGPGIDEPICMMKSPAYVYYYHFDGLGSVVAESNYTGQVVEKNSYDVFGELNRISNIGNPYLFTVPTKFIIKRRTGPIKK